MNPGVESHWINCPYCGESIELLIDTSVEQQEYIEDCFVCCRPIGIHVEIGSAGGIQVNARDENEC